MNIDKLGGKELRELFQKMIGAPTESQNYDWMRRKIRASRRFQNGDGAAAKTTPAAKPAAKKAERDPRLPNPGSLIKKTYHGKELVVKVLADGFEFHGKRWKSLSGIAEHVADGQSRSGFDFFKLNKKAKA